METGMGIVTVVVSGAAVVPLSAPAAAETGSPVLAAAAASLAPHPALPQFLQK